MGKHLSPTERRKARVRRGLATNAGGRPRLSVFRSSEQIYAQIIDDSKGVTVAAASSLEKTLREELKTGANVEAAKRIGLDRRARQGCGRDAGRVRPWRLSLSWARQGARRGRPRRRPRLLNPASGRRARASDGETLWLVMKAAAAADDREERDSEFVDRLVHINRVAKVVKGGRRFGFAALVVVGDQKGRVGFGHGKAREVPEAIRKATEAAKRGVVRVPLREGRTLHHDVHGRHGAGRVILRAAPAGTGIIAGGPMRAVFEALGVHDVVVEEPGLVQPLQHDPRDLRGARQRGQPPRCRRPAQPEGFDDPGPSRRRRGRRL